MTDYETNTTPDPAGQEHFSVPGELETLAEATEAVEDPKGPKPSPTTGKGSKARRIDPVAPYAVVGGGEKDDVFLSRAVPIAEAKSRRSLTVHHLQRRLTELGFTEANADLDGRYGTLTERAVISWQDDRGYTPTGRLTPEQFEAVFEADPNVVVVLD